MKVAIVGAGAIGAFLGAMLARAGEDVTLIARGAHLRAMQEHGVRVRGEIGDFQIDAKATDNPATVGEVDVIVLALKTHSVPAIVASLRPMLGPNTSVVTAQNGFPWWYFYRQGSEWEGTHLESVDPGGVISEHIDPARVIGCVVYPSTEIVEPGVVPHMEGTRFAIGEPDGSKSERCRRSPIRSSSRPALSDSHQHSPRHLGQADGQRRLQPHQCLTRATLIEIVNALETRGTRGRDHDRG
jgi:2-dehydropantoate 2-reductase